MTATVKRDPTSSVRMGTGWRVIASQESRDLWLSGRAPVLLFIYSVLLSVTTYLAATNQVLNFLEQREAVHLALQVAVVVGVLVTLVVSADGISGERERGTLESVLLTPVPRRAVVVGKLLAALTLWLGAFLVSVPYVWVLGRGVSIVGLAVTLGFVVGTLLSVALGAFGLLVSGISSSNKFSLAACFFVVLAMFAPTQLPKMASSPVGNALIRVDPVSAGMHYMTAVLVNGHAWTRDLSYLISPVVAAVAAAGVLIAAGARTVRLMGAVSAE